MVHHRNFARLRPRVGDRRAGARRPRRRHRARHRRRSTTSPQKYGDALLPLAARRHRPRRGLRRRRAGPRPLRPPRHRRQQRRLRPLRHRRGADEQEARDQIETNLFGALWVTQAALPFLREQGSGHIIQVSSIGGITAFPNVGIYHASKWALEGFCQALAQEVEDFGIHVTLIEPGGFSTDWAGSSARHAEPLDAYEAARGVAAAARGATRRATRRRRPRRCCGSSTPTSRRCGCSSAERRWHRGEGLREPARDVGRVAAGRRARAGLIG